MLKILLLILFVLVVLFVAASYWVSRPLFSEARTENQPLIAGPDIAWTFARSSEGLIWVLGHEADAVSGVNLTEAFGEDATADLIEFVTGLDEASLQPLVAQQREYPLSELIKPLDYAFPYVAAGTNFKEHAEEVYSDDPPFLFPKLAKAGRWRDSVPFRPRLDFEAELCMFPLADICSPDDLPPFGLVICNDFTDRWTLIKELSLRKPLGLTGFASGKGCKGCMPTGYLVVVPRSPDFYLSLDLTLYVNDRLRQRFSMQDVILRIEDIIAQAFEKQGERYEKGEETVSLLPSGYIPRGTLILTGTAAGVIFKPLNIWNQGFYLREGDVVRTEGKFLGHLENRVSAR